MNRIIAVVIMLLSGFGQHTTHAAYNGISNGTHWYDSDGNRIEAHGGGFIRVGETYYWFGEDKSHNHHTFKAINCYSSTDLVRWKFRNSVLTPQTNPHLANSSDACERPKVLYNSSTTMYVMWVHWTHDYRDHQVIVCSCDTIDGDYAMHKRFHPNGIQSGDCALFKDEDGTAYFLSANYGTSGDLWMHRLTADYLDVDGSTIEIYDHQYREAPAVFKAHGLYYLFTSGCKSWDPCQQQYSTAPTMWGPWSSRKDIGNADGYDTQTTFVLPVQSSSATTYVYMGDRWKDPDFVGSKYVWLPIQWNRETPSLDYYDSWSIDAATGQWHGSGNLQSTTMPAEGTGHTE